MAVYETSETFMSIEGEGPYSGHPTVYIRFARCNFTCKGFNNPTMEADAKHYAPLGFKPKDFARLEDVPMITRGCDSQYAVNPEFAHMWKKQNENELGQELLNILPYNSFANPKSGKRVILSITGGEPTLRAKFIPTLLNTPELAEAKIILVETNCAVPLKHDFIMEINKWLCADVERKWIWSNSPKLSVSGEKWDDAIRPEIALMQRNATGREFGRQVEQYFKFVCGPSEENFDEVARAMEEYYAAGIPRTVGVYIMPTSCILEQQQAVSKQVAALCIERGYIYCHRVHLDVYGNVVGT